MSGQDARPVVVLADDDGAITSNLAPFLDRAGFTVHIASDGEAALEMGPPRRAAAHEVSRSSRCSRSWAASSISLCRHSAARYMQAMMPIRWMRLKSP
jgi:CheY-like chemotaxis protein